MMFEVLESSWEEFAKDMKSSMDLDQLIAAHTKYLTAISYKSLLSSPTLQKDLTSILDLIIRFCRTQENLYLFATEEAAKRSRQVSLKYERNLKNKWAKEEKHFEFVFDSAYSTQQLAEIRAQSRNIQIEYSNLLNIFLGTLAKQKEESLRLLCWRLDFNEYYDQQNQRFLAAKLATPAEPSEDEY
jgi:gamma-tubulin complex component 3